MNIKQTIVLTLLLFCASVTAYTETLQEPTENEIQTFLYFFFNDFDPNEEDPGIEKDHNKHELRIRFFDYNLSSYCFEGYTLLNGEIKTNQQNIFYFNLQLSGGIIESLKFRYEENMDSLLIYANGYQYFLADPELFL